ncbi:HipA-like protein [Trinickia symbiotica]|nr:HipA-like protein [Trinickia symbiotica]
MARRTRANRLDLWINGLPVGHWESTYGGERFRYRPDWIENPQGRPLSLSLPFTPGNQPYHGAIVQSYFDNLLPDSEQIRRRIATRYKADGTSAFQLLAKLGPTVWEQSRCCLPRRSLKRCGRSKGVR